MSNFVEVILVQLSHKTGKVTVFKVLWKNGFGKSLVLFTDLTSHQDYSNVCETHL